MSSWRSNLTADLTASSVKFPADSVHAMKSNDHYTVEADQEVKTQ